MNKKSIYIYNDDWFDQTALSNPRITLDHKLDDYYPEYYEVNYDVRLLATEEDEIADQFNDYKQRYGTKDINELKGYVIKKNPQAVLLDGFDQEQFDYIIIDLPPVNIVSDAVSISSLITGMVVVVREEYTEKKELERCFRQLKLSNVNVLGCVMNEAKSGGGSYGRYKKYRYYKYYRYYYKKDSAEDKKS